MRREDSEDFQKLVREVGEREANRIYDARAAYFRDYRKKQKEDGNRQPSICRQKKFFSKLADEYELGRTDE